MHNISFLFYAVEKMVNDFIESRRSLKNHISRLRKSGYTKTIFDMDGHTILIQSHNHVEDNRA